MIALRRPILPWLWLLCLAACIAFASFVQLADQQLWDSLRKRSTNREFAGSSRSIFGLAASYSVID